MFSQSVISLCQDLRQDECVCLLGFVSLAKYADRSFQKHSLVMDDNRGNGIRVSLSLLLKNKHCTLKQTTRRFFSQPSHNNHNHTQEQLLLCLHSLSTHEYLAFPPLIIESL